MVCEIGRAHDEDPLFARDERSTLHRLGGEDGADALIIPLNEDNPTLGTLIPPQQPGDRSPRIEVSFGVNEGRLRSPAAQPTSIWVKKDARDATLKKRTTSKSARMRTLA